MADSLGAAFVEIHPETAGFAPDVLSAVEDAVGPAADRAGGLLTEAFTEAAQAASEALSSIEVAPIPVDAETGSAEEAISALGAEAVDLPVDADTVAAAAEIDALSAPVDVFVSADTAAAVAEIDALSEPVDIPVFADTSAAVAEIDDALGSVTIDIPVDVDAEAATAALSDLGDSATLAGSGVGDLGTATSGFEAAAGLASGSAAGLGSAVGQLGGQAKAGATAVAALAAVGGVFFNAAVQDAAATFRFEQVLGDLADTVNTLDLDGLSVTLDELGVLLGTSDEAMKNAAASFVQLGRAAGGSDAQIGLATESILLLAANARALNPELGEVGDIAERLTGVFASGRTRGLIPFGISLSQDEILARAMAETGKTTANELTAFEKAAAGAALAMDQLGGSIAENILAAGDNPVIQLASIREKFGEFIETIGQPLIAPVFELLEQLEPVAEEVAAAFGDLLRELLPLVIDLLPLLSTAVKASGDLVHAALPLLQVLNDVVGPLVTVHTALTDVAGAEDDVTHSTDEMSRAIGESGLDRFADFFGRGPEAERMARHIRELANASGSFGAALDLVVVATSDYSGATADALEATQHLADVLAALSDVHDAHAAAIQADKKAVGEFIAVALDEFQAKVDSFVASVTSALPEVGDAFDAVQSDIDAFVSSATSALPDIGQAFADAFDQANEAADPGQLLENLRGQEEALAGFAANLQALQDQGFTALAAQLATQGPAIGGALAKAILDGGPGLASALDEQVQITSQGLDDISAEIDAFAEEQGPQKLLEALEEQAEAVAGFTLRIAALQQQGLTALAGELAAKGPEIGGALAKSILEGEPGLAIALNDQVEATQGALDDSVAYFEEHGPELGLSAEDAAKAASLGMETNLDLEGPVSAEVDAAANFLEFEGAVAVALAATAMAQAAVAAATAIANDPVSGPRAAGAAFSIGMANGITDFVGDVVAAAAAAANAAVAQIGDLWKTGSPSRVAMDLGADFGLGLALGMEDQVARVGRSAGKLAGGAMAALDFGAPAPNLGFAPSGNPWFGGPAAQVLGTGPGGGMHMDIGGVTINYPEREMASESVPRELKSLAFLMGGT